MSGNEKEMEKTGVALSLKGSNPFLCAFHNQKTVII
jgi:hypothetical protein